MVSRGERMIIPFSVHIAILWGPVVVGIIWRFSS
jgi:hypothetical protein